MNFCRCCGAKALVPLDGTPPGTEGDWFHCNACGGSTSRLTYADVRHLYDARYVTDHHQGDKKSMAQCEIELSTNRDMFVRHRNGIPNNDFLDVGTNEGAALRVMGGCGFSVHGFDVNPAAKNGRHITIAPYFCARFFPRRYSAVLAREVIEHVEGWRGFLWELHQVTLHRGIVQVQTPRPSHPADKIVYQKAHLQIIPPHLVLQECLRLGFELLDCLFWPPGQLWVFRKTAGF